MRIKNIITYNKLIPCIDICTIVLLIASLRISNDCMVLLLIITPVPYLLITRRKNLLPALLIALIMGIVWGIPASSMYVYEAKGFIIGSVNLYPVCYWTMGLFGTYFIFYRFQPAIKHFWAKWVIFSLIFWFGLIAVETLSYNIFNIRNLATAGYPGLPLLNCIHTPYWMKLVYFSMGPVYFLLLTLLEKTRTNNLGIFLMKGLRYSMVRTAQKPPSTL